MKPEIKELSDLGIIHTETGEWVYDLSEKEVLELGDLKRKTLNLINAADADFFPLPMLYRARLSQGDIAADEIITFAIGETQSRLGPANSDLYQKEIKLQYLRPTTITRWNSQNQPQQYDVLECLTPSALSLTKEFSIIAKPDTKIFFLFPHRPVEGYDPASIRDIQPYVIVDSGDQFTVFERIVFPNQDPQVGGYETNVVIHQAPRVPNTTLADGRETPVRYPEATTLFYDSNTDTLRLKTGNAHPLGNTEIMIPTTPSSSDKRLIYGCVDAVFGAQDEKITYQFNWLGTRDKPPIEDAVLSKNNYLKALKAITTGAPVNTLWQDNPTLKSH